MKHLAHLPRYLNAWSPWVEIIIVIGSIPPLLFPTLSLQATVFVLFVLALWWMGQILIPSKSLPLTPFNGALLLWSISVGVGILVTAYPDVTLSKATGLLLGLAVWRGLVIWADSRQKLTWALLGLVFLGAGFAGVGMLSVRWGAKVPVLGTLIARLPQRLLTLPGGPDSGVNANQLAGLLTFLFPLMAALSCGQFWGTRREFLWAGRIFSWIALLFFAGLLLLTQSRSGWLGGITGVFALAFLWGMNGSRHWRWFTLITALVILVGAVAMVITITPDRIAALWGVPGGVDTEIGQLSLAGRVEIWGRALYAIQDFPFTGCGLGTFREVVWVLYPLFTIAPDNDFAHAHNIFLQVALDTGIPGLLAYLALLGIATNIAWQTARRDVTLRPVALGLLAGLVALHIYGLTDALAPGSKPGLLFWYGLGLFAVLDRLVYDAAHTGTAHWVDN